MPELRGAKPAAESSRLALMMRRPWSWGIAALIGSILVLGAEAQTQEPKAPPRPTHPAPARPSGRPAGPSEAPPGVADRRTQPLPPASGLPVRDEVPLGFRVARLRYSGGGDWYSNPSSLPNLAKALAERTSIPVDTFEEKKVAITDERLFDYPFIYMNGHGTVRFSTDEVSRLRSYLLSGGFLFADDNYGMDKTFRREIARVFPEQPLVEVPLNHPIFHSFYDLPAVPKVHEHDGLRAQGLGIVKDGRLVVFYTYQSDIGDGIEDAHVHNDPPAIREQAMKMAVNVVVYAMTS